MKEFFLQNQHILQILIAVGLGLVMGLRAEIDVQNEPRKQRGFMGVRTAILFSVLGASSTFFTQIPWLPVVVFAGSFLLLTVVYAYGSFIQHKRRLAPVLAALTMLVVGLLVGYGYTVPAILLTIVLVVLNEFKSELHEFVATLTIPETRGVLQLLLFTGIVLPFLPQTAIDPWGVLVPFNIWLLVMFISGMNFVGYFLTKHFGEKGGLLLTSFLGALASSTAVAVSLAEQSVDGRKKNTHLLTTGLLIAMSVMELRVMLVWGLLSPTGLGSTFILVPFAMAIASLGWAWRNYKLAEKEKRRPPAKIDVVSPFELLPALKFGALFIVVLLAIALGQQMLGDAGVLVASFLSGLADVDAVVLSSIETLRSGEILQSLAEKAVFVGLIVNTLVKLGYVGLFGSRELVRRSVSGVLIVTAVGVVTFLLL